MQLIKKFNATQEEPQPTMHTLQTTPSRLVTIADEECQVKHSQAMGRNNWPLNHSYEGFTLV
jgi:hypothetical protein